MNNFMVTKKGLLLLALLLILTPIALFIAYRIGPHTGSTITSALANFQGDEEEEVEAAIRKAIDKQTENVPLLVMYDTIIEDIRISADGNWATGWIVPADPETGNVVPTEPGLVILRKEGETWVTILPSDPMWVIVIRQVPTDLIPEEQKSLWRIVSELRPSAAPAATYSGYLLPWAGGETMALTQSVGHDRYTPSGNAHYAFDFAKPGYPSGLFNVLAAKGGRVKQAVWNHPNGDPNNGNYIVLEDTTTSPTTYQLYLHLAQNSIPPEIRAIGTYVAQGQLIGVADDTGVSSGNHLHFMVHTYPYSYWGASVDITFDDVNINGGRPRIRSDESYCGSDDHCDVFQTTYVSGNFLNPDHTPPTGGIENPPNSATISSNLLYLAGWASDDNSGIASAQFKARYNGSWNDVGEPFATETFVTAWEMCADNVPDGPLSLAVEVRDKANNVAEGLPGLTHITKNYTCPSAPPACVPTSNQVAIFSSVDYQGNCVMLNAGDYPSYLSLGNLGNNNAVSVQVGSNVQATLYMGSNYLGRSETFIASDSNLADNRIGENTVSSVRVRSRGTAPAAPVPTWPEDGAVFKSDSSLSLVWRDSTGGVQFQARLTYIGADSQFSPWEATHAWHISSLAPGNYTWQVKAKNGSSESAWSSERSLIIQSAASNPGASITAPVTDNMETVDGWSHNDTWSLTNDENHTPGGASSWKYDVNSQNGYDTGAPNAGYLTSPPISIPASGEHFLRFWYMYETESPEIQWDQRWVQISVDGGKFTNLLQLSDDAANYWLSSPALSLAGFAGKTVQVRFYFATLDNVRNNFRGWFIDDFSITATSPPACAADNNNTPVQATPIAYGSVVDAVICPGGDVDYYKFQAVAGDNISVRTEAQVNGSPLDTYLFLYDIDGRSLLASNDDIVLYEWTDSAGYYRFKRTGTYFLKVRSWDHPTSGGEGYTYTLRLLEDDEDPIASFVFPSEGGGVPVEQINLRVDAQDSLSGVRVVQFFWHSADWQNGNWIPLGEDWDGSDGWSFPFDVSAAPEPRGIAFYAAVYDWAGNWIGTGVWNLGSLNIFLPVIRK